MFIILFLYSGTNATADKPIYPVYLSINVAGFEAESKVYPGEAGTDWSAPTMEEIRYLKRRGVRVVRLPFVWERMQPRLMGPLNSAFMKDYLRTIDLMGGEGIETIVDCHNFARYNQKPNGEYSRGLEPLGEGLQPDALVDLWERLASRLAAHSVLAYDIMNEPFGLKRPSIWPETAQRVANAIRKIDRSTWLMIEGYNFSSAETWVAFNSDLKIVDPVDKVVYSAHVYPDHDGSGTSFKWSDEVSRGMSDNVLIKRTSVFYDWLIKHSLQGSIGESNVGNDNDRWIEMLDKFVAYCLKRGISISVWVYGRGYTTVPYTMYATPDGTQALQWAVFEKYLPEFESEKRLSLSARLSKDASTFAVTISYFGYLSAPVQANLSVYQNDNYLYTAFVTLPSGLNPSTVSNYTPSSDLSSANIRVDAERYNSSNLRLAAPFGRQQIDLAHDWITADASFHAFTEKAGTPVSYARFSDNSRDRLHFAEHTVQADVDRWYNYEIVARAETRRAIALTVYNKSDASIRLDIDLISGQFIKRTTKGSIECREYSIGFTNEGYVKASVSCKFASSEIRMRLTLINSVDDQYIGAGNALRIRSVTYARLRR